MKIHRKIIPAVSLALALSASAPGVAAANSLLSGYGGPGQGSQAILGSALVNGSGRGAGPPSAGGGPGTTAASTPAATGAATPARGTSGSARRSAKARPRGARPTRTAKAPGGGAKGASPTYNVSRQASQPVLGISTGDLLGMIVAVGALILVAVATRAAARRGAGMGRPKGIASRNRADS
jgi:hypothetical protein